MARVFQGRTERRLALVILLTAIVPLATAVLLAGSLFRQAASVWFDPEVGHVLDRGVDLYKDYVRAIKDDMRHQTDAVAADDDLREVARKHNVPALESQLAQAFPRFPELVALAVEDDAGRIFARRDRGRPVDEAKERSLEVRRSLNDAGTAPFVVATFAVDRARLDELERAGGVVAKYHQLEGARDELYQGYLRAYAALLGITMLVTVALGSILARGVTRRIARLAAAQELVATGDLSVRVPVTGTDELTELARTFNRMLGEMEHSRARIEYLQRIGAWQEMAQRLAHEIKNPLTPIQLAVQECHRKYQGDDGRFRGLLDTTLEIVEEEVGTLRRLVGTFSRFARMPHAELAPSNLRDFLRECSEQLAHLEGEDEGGDLEPLPLQNVDVTWTIPTEDLPATIDRQMLRRVVVNLVRNAVQAIRGGRDVGHVQVSAHRAPGGEGTVLDVEDDGPGVPEDQRARVFDPYFTTKSAGTGLGLAIVKKVVVEHGGEIEVDASPSLGGARFRVRLPAIAGGRAPSARRRADLLLVAEGKAAPGP